jgi:hypothetical protein
LLSDNDNDVIRAAYDEFHDEKNMKSHLAAVFDVSLSWVCKKLSNPTRGVRGRTGRPAVLAEFELDRVIEHILEQQRSCACVSIRELTDWINNTLLDGDIRKVSLTFVSNNKRLKDKFHLVSPQIVEYLRVEACNCDNFDEFFDRLRRRYSRHFDPDFIINVDETSTTALKTKRSTKVLYDPDLNLRPISLGETKEEHVTLTCAVSASGRLLCPCFIIKNQSVSGEADLHTPLFPCGPYMLQYTNGWHTSVSFALIAFECFYAT